MKKYEVCVFCKVIPEIEEGEYDTIAECDTYEEAEEIFFNTLHEGVLGYGQSPDYFVDSVCIYERQPDGSQECIKEQLA